MSEEVEHARCVVFQENNRFSLEIEISTNEQQASGLVRGQAHVEAVEKSAHSAFCVLLRMRRLGIPEK